MQRFRDTHQNIFGRYAEAYGKRNLSNALSQVVILNTWRDMIIKG